MLEGFEIQRGVFGVEEVEGLRAEAERVAGEAGTVCVRRLGERSAVFRALATGARLGAMAGTGMRFVRGILFDKTADENWPVAWHQDLTVAVKEKVETEGYGPWTVKRGEVHAQAPVGLLERMLTLRVHLDETPAENGALRVVPGSQRWGVIGSGEIAEHVERGEVVCECAAGDVVVMSPLLLHASRRSVEPGRRRVLHFEYAPADGLAAGLAWGE